MPNLIKISKFSNFKKRLRMMHLSPDFLYLIVNLINTALLWFLELYSSLLKSAIYLMLEVYFSYLCMILSRPIENLKLMLILGQYLLLMPFESLLQLLNSFLSLLFHNKSQLCKNIKLLKMKVLLSVEHIICQMFFGLE